MLRRSLIRHSLLAMLLTVFCDRAPACLSHNPSHVNRAKSVTLRASQQQLDQKLVDAIRKDEVTKALFLIRRGANVRQRVTHYVNVKLSPLPNLVWIEEDMQASTPPTLLMLAVANGSREIVKALLQKGASGREKGDYLYADQNDYDAVYLSWYKKCAALHLAAGQGDTALVAILLHAGCPRDATDEEGETALLVAAAHREWNVVKQLLKAHCNVNLPDKHDVTALECAANSGEKEIYNYLKRAGAKGDYPIRPSSGGVEAGGIE